MAGLSAFGALSTQLEQVQDSIPFLVEKSDVLDKYIQDNGRAKKVSTKSFRIVFETALPGSVSKVFLDSTVVGLPEGGSSEWNQGTITPLAVCVPIEWTKLAEMAAAGDVAVVNTVSTQLGRATDSLRKFRDIFLQSDGTGKIGAITAVDLVNRILTLNNSGFGSRNVAKNQKVGIWNGNALRGTATIQRLSKVLGAAQTVVIDAVPVGTANGDVIRVDGVEDGGPIFINGIPVFHNTSTVGIALGVDRGVNTHVVANGVDAASAQVTQPLLKVPFNQIVQELGPIENAKELLVHTHPAQVAAYEEMGWQLQMYPLQGGKAGDLDLFFVGKKTIEGRPIVANPHADNSRWDYMNIKAWGKVKWGNPPFWFTQEGRRVFEIYAANGSPTPGARSFLVDCYQTYCDNMKSISSVTNAKIPVNY